jgi:lipoyl(octanoyl) transferase
MYKQPNRKVSFLWLSRAPYEPTWAYQEALLQYITNIKIQNRNENTVIPTPNFLIFCEHPHVYTLGKSGKSHHLLLSPEECKQRGIEFFPINRGGDITYHGPGQLVAYPIFDLENFQTDLNVYLRKIEEVIIQTIQHYGIQGHRIKGLTGVWVDIEKNPRKIAAIGIRCSRWISMHGLALNVHTDLSYFQNIVPCGIADKGVTSIQEEIKQEVNLKETMNIMKQKFSEIFEFEFVEEPFPFSFRKI